FINPYALKARGLSLSQVTSSIASGNSDLPAGALDGKTRTYAVRAEGQLTAAAAYNNLVLAYHDAAPVRLDDEGRAANTIQASKRQTTCNSEPTIVLSVHRQPRANTVKAAREVSNALPALADQAPGGSELNVINDRSVFIQHSING